MFFLNKIKILILLLFLNGFVCADNLDAELKKLEGYLVHGFDTSIDINSILKQTLPDILKQEKKIQLEFYKTASILLLDVLSKDGKKFAKAGLELAKKTKNISKITFFKIILKQINISEKFSISQNLLNELIDELRVQAPSHDKAVSYLYISRICRNTEFYYLQLKTIQLGIDTLSTLNDSSFSALRIKAELFNQLGLYYMGIKGFKQAETYLRTALVIYEKIDNVIMASIVFFNIGIILQDTNNHQEALKYFKKTIQVKNQLNENYGLGLAHMYLSYSFLKLNKVTQAENHIDQAIGILEGIEANERLPYTYLFKAQISEAKNNKKNTLKYIRLSLSFSVKFFNAEKQTIVFDRIYKLLKKVDDTTIKNEFLELFFTQKNTLMENHIGGVLEKSRAETKLAISNNTNDFLMKLDVLNKKNILIQQVSNRINKKWIGLLFFITLILFLSILRQIRISRNYRKQSLIDFLTGLFNRKAYYQKLDHIYNNTYKSNKKPYLLLFDIDDFKNINDKYGHSIGDKVLIELGKLLKQVKNDFGFSARIGGEEFALVYFSEDKKTVLKYCENLINEIAALKIIYQAIEIRITVSLGVSEINQSENLNTIISKTDKLMYAAKENGRNRFESLIK